jgi:hypothetical protein
VVGCQRPVDLPRGWPVTPSRWVIGDAARTRAGLAVHVRRTRRPLGVDTMPLRLLPVLGGTSRVVLGRPFMRPLGKLVTPRRAAVRGNRTLTALVSLVSGPPCRLRIRYRRRLARRGGGAQALLDLLHPVVSFSRPLSRPLASAVSLRRQLVPSSLIRFHQAIALRRADSRRPARGTARPLPQTVGDRGRPDNFPLTGRQWGIPTGR